MKTCKTCVDFAHKHQLRFVKTALLPLDYCSLVQQSHWAGFDVKTFATVHRSTGDVALSRTSLQNEARMRDVLENGVFEMDEESIEFEGRLFMSANT